MITINDNLIPVLDEMLYELSEQRLEVCLIPSQKPEIADNGGMIRAVTGQNPLWYKELCEAYPCTRIKKRNPRRDGTRIKRPDTLNILKWMIKNKKSRSLYAPFIKDVAEGRLESYEQWKKEEDAKYNVPFDNQF